jgi:chitin disaccharide deacetylase
MTVTIDQPPTGFVLCADDYGLAPGLGTAIRHLLSLKRLSATSCMTGSRFWPREAELLKPLAGDADIGLHLTLTDQLPLAPMPNLAPEGRLPSILRLIRLAYTGALARPAVRAEIEAELTRQFDRFEATLGRAPDFLDGHQHVHQLPIVRDVTIDLFRTRVAPHAKSGTVYVRYCTEPLGAMLKRYSLREAFGVSILGQGFAQRARALGIPGNRRFAGIHDFTGQRPYGVLFDRFIDHAESGLLVMCHPGLSDPELAALDPVTTQREEEYRYLLSDAFPIALQKHGVAVARFDDSKG